MIKITNTEKKSKFRGGKKKEEALFDHHFQATFLFKLIKPFFDFFN